ncbi:MAG TPA: guanylate kinase [Fimbriimonas sp.]|nr:guanylate kinase [Fimbriimonas sp.]
MSKGLLMILSGPSGVGKDTVINAWKERNPDVERVVAYTTRDPRPGEVDGVDYRFISRSEFYNRADCGEFLEYKEVHEYYYATPYKDVEELMAEGKIAVLKIDVKGALTVMALRGDAVAVFLLPPDADELERRIKERGTEDTATIIKRLRNAQEEIALAIKYQHRIINDDVNRVVDCLENIAREGRGV